MHIRSLSLYNRFTTRFAPFVVLSMFCSGTFPVLNLVSSSIFGLNFFSSGLLSSELRELSKIKIHTTIYFENVPQILIQIIYLQSGTDDLSVTILALTASLLSVASTLIIYFGEKNIANQYTVAKYFLRFATSSGTAMSPQAKAKMDSKKKKKKALMEQLRGIVGCAANKQIEIGSIMVKDNGVVVHIQHLVTANTMEQFKKEVDRVNITMNDYMESLYGKKKKIKKVFDAMWTHFELDGVESKSEWAVRYQLELDDGDDEILPVDSPSWRHMVAYSGDGHSYFAGGLATTNQPKQHIKHASNASEIEMQPMPRDGDYVSEYAGDPSDVHAIIGEITAASRKIARLSKLLDEKSGNQSVLQSAWDNTE